MRTEILPLQTISSPESSPKAAFNRRSLMRAALGLSLGLPLALTGCQTPEPERLVLPEISFAHRPVLTFAAGSVDTITEFKPSFQDPHIEHLLPQPPARVAERWVRDRVRLDNSQPNSLRVVIKDASVIEQDIAKTPGLRGNFTTDQVARFEVSVEMAVELRDARGFKVGEAAASAKRANTLSEKATLNDRDRLIHDLIRLAMNDLDAELEKSIRSYMPLYVQ
ncbi:MAG: hypothetical protein KF827_00400 [Ferrovibrio sp.]|nr:hypothetical protein [Ferrovibrio sp.]